MPSAARWCPLQGGKTSQVFLVEPTTRNKAAQVCKLTRKHKSSALFPVDPVAEASVMAALSPALSPPVTDLRRFGNAHCLVYAFEPDCGAAISTEDFARLLRHVHRQSGVFGGRLGLKPVPLIRETLFQAGLRFLEQNSWPGSWIAQIKMARKTPMGPTVLLHGDPVRANAVSTLAGPKLIDWQCVCLGDAVLDLAIALSPAMHHVYGGNTAPLDRDRLLTTYDCQRTRARFEQAAPALHVQMIGHCLWRATHGSPEFGSAIALELHALRQLL